MTFLFRCGDGMGNSVAGKGHDVFYRKPITCWR